MTSTMRLFEVIDLYDSWIVSAPTKEDAILLLVACGHIPDETKYCESVIVKDITPSIFSSEIVKYVAAGW